MKHETFDTSDAAQITVSVIDTLDGLAAIKAEWDELFDADLEATVFLSYSWLHRAFAANALRWSVLVARDRARGGNIVGILPLKYRTHWSDSRQSVVSEIEAGGRLMFSEYVGFLCRPGVEVAAIRALARHSATMPWSKLSVRYIAQARRAKIFTDAFEGGDFRVEFRRYMINKGQTNNLLCPQVELPESFDQYLADSISSNQRQKYRRLLRKKIDSGEFRVTVADATTAMRDIDILLGLWQIRWQGEKGASKAAEIARNYREVLRSAKEDGILFLPVLWQGDTPIGALGHIEDRKNGILHFIVGGRQISSDEGGIGQLLHMASIRHAIAQGFICYDFCHGNEPYKYSYGAADTEALYFTIRRRSKDTTMLFDPICTPQAIDRIRQLLKAKEVASAEAATEALAKSLR